MAAFFTRFDGAVLVDAVSVPAEHAVVETTKAMTSGIERFLSFMVLLEDAADGTLLSKSR
jgi:hypothetical protein